MRRPRGDEGSVLVLTLGLTAIVLVMVGVVINVSAAALASRAVSSAADGAAVSGAQALDTQAYLAGDVGDELPLSSGSVRQRVGDYESRARSDQPGLTLDSRVEGGVTVVVTARREVDLPFSGWLGRDALVVTAESRARAPIVQP